MGSVTIPGHQTRAQQILITMYILTHYDEKIHHGILHDIPPGPEKSNEMCDWIIKKHQRAFNYSVCVRDKDERLDITGFDTHIPSSPFILLVSHLKAFSASLLPKIALLRSPARADIVCLFHKNIGILASHHHFTNNFSTSAFSRAPMTGKCLLCNE